MIDLRVTLSRPERASFAAEGVDCAHRYSDLRRTRCAVNIAAVLATPRADSEQISQLFIGEAFDVLTRDGDFAWGQAGRDGYVGWVEARHVSTELVQPSHWVATPCAVVFRAPQIRAPTLGVVGMNALVAVSETQGAFSLVDTVGWIASRQLAPIGMGFLKPARAAEMFLQAPYVWGGRGHQGLDCSGLIQQALFAAGRSCPRDADQQAVLGRETLLEHLGVGDLVVWKGHIGMMLDNARLIHANAHHMAVAIEPLSAAIDRIKRAGSGLPTAYRTLNRACPDALL